MEKYPSYKANNRTFFHVNNIVGIQMEEIRTIFSVIALLISFWSAYTVRRLWYQTHRPIVSAVIRENSSGVGICLFDLVLVNSGNRPATEITFSVNRNDIKNILIDNITEQKVDEVYKIFGKSKLQILLADDEAKTFFYAFSTSPNTDMNILKYESNLPITIRYKDLENRNYISKQNLFVRDNKGFGGSSWGE